MNVYQCCKAKFSIVRVFRMPWYNILKVCIYIYVEQWKWLCPDLIVLYSNTSGLCGSWNDNNSILYVNKMLFVVIPTNTLCYTYIILHNSILNKFRILYLTIIDYYYFIIMELIDSNNINLFYKGMKAIEIMFDAWIGSVK